MGYAILGRITWWAIKRVLSKKAAQNQVKIGAAAAAVVAAVLVGGVLAARSASSDAG
jgi:predicted TIM-barrel enzyme